TAAAVNAYWDNKYSGFTRSGNPTPLTNCKDYATGGGNYRADVTYDLEKSSDRDSLKGALNDRNHVVQLGSQESTAHYVKTEGRDGSVTIKQKDGDSAYYHKAMTSAEAVTYLRSKHSTAIVLRPA